ncbi:MAG: efflux RND transporter periplasmic adaptor subunit, partial [Polyangiaceae bacterium]
MNRAWAIFVGVLLLQCHRDPTSSGSPSAAEAGAVVGSATVDRGTVEDTLETYGTVAFAEETERSVTFVQPGQVLAVPVVEGQLVKNSQELLRVGAVPHGSPEVQQALIAAEFAARELARIQRLVDEKLATNQDLQNAEKQVATANAAVRSLTGGGAAGTPLRASMDDIVAKVLVHRGDLAQVGQTALLLAARDSLSVRVGFEVEDLPKLSEGLPVRIDSAYQSAAQQPANAVLSTLHRVVDEKTQLVEGIIRVSEPPDWMAPGLSVHVVAVLAAHANALSVPLAALLEQGGKDGLFVIDGGRASWRTPPFGLRDARQVEVLSGLNAG